MKTESRAPNRAEALRAQLAELQTQYLRYIKIKELYNVSFEFETKRVEKAISLCRQAIHASEGKVAADVG